MKKSLLDTSILIAFLKREEKVSVKIEEYLQEFNTISLSIISYYEILRGLTYLGNNRRIMNFEELMDRSEIVLLNRPIMRKASGIYSTLKRSGELIEDADILIAASSVVRNMTLVTHNEDHFRRIEDLTVKTG